MIIFTNVRKSVDYKDFILQNVHPATFFKIDGSGGQGLDARDRRRCPSDS